MKEDPIYQPHMEESSKQDRNGLDIWSISDIEFNQFFENIYNEYVDNLYRFAYFRLTDTDKSTDVVQDIFTKYYAYLKKARKSESKPDINHKAFLFRSLRNAIIDQYRLKKNASLDAMLEDGMNEELISHEGDFMKTETEISFKELTKHIEKLKPEAQELLYMRYFEDMSVTDIAVALNQRENTISVKLHRITDTLRKMLNS